MVQLGGFHMGKAENVAPPQLDIGEAFLLSKFLFFRYDCLEQTNLYYKSAHDPEFKQLINIGLITTLQAQIKTVEEQMHKYKVPQPSREPKSVKNYTSSPGEMSLITDQLIYLRIYTGCSEYLKQHVEYVTSMVTNDSLRKIFIGFLKDETNVYNNLIKYGKLKGWLPVYPMYKPE